MVADQKLKPTGPHRTPGRGTRPTTCEWPEQLLSAHPVRRVLVCGARLPPPAGSQSLKLAQLYVPLAGTLETQVEIKGHLTTVRLKPGTALLAPAKAWVLPATVPPAHLLSLLFGRKQVCIRITAAGQAPALPQTACESWLPCPQNAPARKLIHAFLGLAADEGFARVLPEVARALLGCLGSQLQRGAPALPSKGRVSVKAVSAFLRAHHHHKVTRDTVAERFGISRSHLSRLFGRQRHGGFSSCLSRIRIEHAKRLLKDASLKLDDIALSCGFDDTAYFCRVFKNLTKATPRAYRTGQNQG